MEKNKRVRSILNALDLFIVFIGLIMVFTGISIGFNNAMPTIGCFIISIGTLIAVYAGINMERQNLRPKIYISGKITGLDPEEAKRLFNEAEGWINANYDYKAVNPMKKVPYVEGKLWEEYMCDDIRLLIDCDAIYMLSNWEDSRGAKIEHEIALSTNKKVFTQITN